MLNDLSGSLQSHLAMPGEVSSCEYHFNFHNVQIVLLVFSITKLYFIKNANLPPPLDVKCFHYWVGLGQVVIWDDSGCPKFLLMKFGILSTPDFFFF